MSRVGRWYGTFMRLAVLALILIGCGTGGAAGAGSAPAGRGPTSGPHGSPHAVGPKVSLVLGDKQVDVGLDEVPQADGMVSLRDLWRAGLPTDEPMLLHFDLYDLHGFNLASRPACGQLLNGTDLASARMDVRTHDVSYKESINDCYRMRAITRIVGIR